MIGRDKITFKTKKKLYFLQFLYGLYKSLYRFIFISGNQVV